MRYSSGFGKTNIYHFFFNPRILNHYKCVTSYNIFDRVKANHSSLLLIVILPLTKHQIVAIHFGTQSRELQPMLLFCPHTQHMVRIRMQNYIMLI